MTLEEIKQLIELVNESGVAELEVERGGNRVRIRRAGTQADIVIAPPPVSAPAAPGSISAPVASASANDENLIYVKSPIVGTYYASPSPDAPPFIKVGDAVSVGQVLCIIESMKLMNEIESEISGVVVQMLVENAKPVEYGEALLAIRPS